MTASPASPDGPDGQPAFTSQAASFPWAGLGLMRDFARDTLATWEALQRQGDAVQVRVLGRRVHFLFHPALLRAVLQHDEQALRKEDRQTAVFRLAQGLNVLTTHGTDWQRQRRLLAPAFAPRRMAEMVQLMHEAITDAHAQALPAACGPPSRLDASAYASRVTMDVMLRVLFSQRMPPPRVAELTAAVQGLLVQGMRMMMWPVIPPAWLPFPGRSRLMAQRSLLRQWVRHHIEARRQGGQAQRQDLLALMLQAQEGADSGTGDPGRGGQGGATLTEREVEDNCLALFLAGHDTSATALTWWMGWMALHPDHADRARAELRAVLAQADAAPAVPATLQLAGRGDDQGPTPPACAGGHITPAQLARLPWLEATLKETLRLRPPITGPFMRQALRDTDLLGVPVRRGDFVSTAFWPAHHDSRWHEDPQVFRPERFLPDSPPVPRGAWMPFGAGPHVCLGQHFSMVEMLLIAARLLLEYRWELADGPALPEPRLDIVLKPARPLMLRIVRNSAAA